MVSGLLLKLPLENVENTMDFDMKGVLAPPFIKHADILLCLSESEFSKYQRSQTSGSCMGQIKYYIKNALRAVKLLSRTRFPHQYVTFPFSSLTELEVFQRVQSNSSNV